MGIYTCAQCKRKVSIVRFDLESVDHRQVCDKCYWKNYNERNLSNTRSK